jgi:1-deoxy-D-xylulose-5-phosphate synthase
MSHYPAGPHLSRIKTPEDLRELFQNTDLPVICDELRQFIVDVVSEKGGHFGASLGVVNSLLHFTTCSIHPMTKSFGM